MTNDSASVKVNLGCGSAWRAEGWIGVDQALTGFIWQQEINQGFLDVDVKKGLPFKDGSVDVLFSSHMLEHFTYAEGVVLLFEMHRVLKVGAPLCLVVPDLDIYLEKLRQRDEQFLKTPEIIGGRPPGNLTDNFLMNLFSDPSFNNTCHKYGYNIENLGSTLKMIGFDNIEKVGFHDFSYWPELKEKAFQSPIPNVEKFSLCVQARKTHEDINFRQRQDYMEAEQFAQFMSGEQDMAQRLNVTTMRMNRLLREVSRLSTELQTAKQKISETGPLPPKPNLAAATTYLAPVIKPQVREPLRINFVMPPVPKISGGPLAIFEYANRLAARGHKITITTYPDSEWAGENPFPWAKFDGEIFYIRNRGAAPPPPNILEGRTAPLYRTPFEWMTTEPRQWLDLINAMPECDLNIATFWTTAFPVYFSQKGKPVYFMQHYEEVFYSMDPNNILQKLAVRASYDLPLYKVANSSWLQKLMRERHGLNVPFSNNGLELRDFSPQPKKSDQDGIIRILTYANPTPWKGFADAMAAMQKVLERYGNKVEWHVFGYQHPYFPETNAYANYTYHPKLSFKDLATLYATCDIALCPSWYESFPLPPLEAMASGTAVITTEYGTEDYAFHERNALVIGARDIEAMTMSLIRLIEDKDLRTRLATAGRETAEGFGWDQAVDKREQILLAIHRGDVDYDVQGAAKFNMHDAAGIDFDHAPNEIRLPKAAVFSAANVSFFYYNGVVHPVANSNLVPELLRRGAAQISPDILGFARIPRGAMLVSEADIPAKKLA